MSWTQRRKEQMREHLQLAISLREQVQSYDEPIDQLAAICACLQPIPLTPLQRERLAIIGRELLRQSRLK